MDQRNSEKEVVTSTQETYRLLAKRTRTDVSRFDNIEERVTEPGCFFHVMRENPEQTAAHQEISLPDFVIEEFKKIGEGKQSKGVQPLKRKYQDTYDDKLLCEGFPETCLGCYYGCSKDIKHPLFQGYLCQSCKLACVLCGDGGFLAMCDDKQCGSSFCFSCIEYHKGHAMAKKCTDLRYLTNAGKRRIRVLFLFDGISTGRVALEESGLDVEVYYSSEVDVQAKQVTRHNFKDEVVEIGDAWLLNHEKIEPSSWDAKHFSGQRRVRNFWGNIPGYKVPFGGSVTNLSSLRKGALSDCVSCPSGYYCLNTGNTNYTGPCAAGYYCTGSAQEMNPTDNVTGNICPIGYYCPVGSSIYSICSPGTYTNSTWEATCAVCPAGFRCTGGSTVDPCPQGQYCPQGIGLATQPCPVGTYGNRTGLSNNTECTDCDPGKYCGTTGLTTPTGDCDAGHYCISGVDTPVPGSTTHTGTGDLCPAGYVCPTGSSFYMPCNPGTYAPTTGLNTCQACPQGYYCENVTVTPVTCPAGHYCPVSTAAINEYPCPAGTYNSVTGSTNSTDCTACPAGSYCEGTGNIAADGLCDAGFWCAGGANAARPYDPGQLNSRLFGFKTNYTQAEGLTDNQRRRLLGRAWSVPVVKQIFKPLTTMFKMKDSE